jgi:DNA-binding XRE family transcriptional regulator
MGWTVIFHDEFDELGEDIQDELLARLQVLAEFGLQLGRPKNGEYQAKFYRDLIRVADARFSAHPWAIRPALKMGKQEVNMRKLNEVIAKLPAARRKKVEARAQALIAEEMTLQDIRKARQLTQAQMAQTLRIGQDSISRLEKRSDMMLSTMRNFVEAMGGELELVVRFPERPPVVIKAIEDVGPAAPARPVKRKKPGLVRAG